MSINIERTMYESIVDKEIKHGHGDNSVTVYSVLHGGPFVHRDTDNLNLVIARVRGVRGRPGQELSKKQERKLKANSF